MDTFSGMPISRKQCKCHGGYRASHSCEGQVVDSTGEPVIGANIVVKGTNTGVISDIDGNFAIDAPKKFGSAYLFYRIQVTGSESDRSFSQNSVD